MRYVFLDPDGTSSVFAVIVHYKTGVCYASQCAGTANEPREAEGFLIPLANTDVCREDPIDIPTLLASFFHKEHLCGGSYDPKVWSPSTIQALAAVIKQIPCWKTERAAADTERTYLRLDLTRLHDLAEAWIPVETPYGPGTLVHDNCD